MQVIKTDIETRADTAATDNDQWAEGRHLQAVRGEASSVRDVLTDAPTDAALVVPGGYNLTPTSTLKIESAPKGRSATEHQQSIAHAIAHAPILITHRLRDITTGQEVLRLAWRKEGRWHGQPIDRAEAADTRAIVRLAGFGFPVNSTNANDVVRYLAAFEAANDGILPTEQVSSQMGWQGAEGEYGFLWGRKQIAGPDAPPVSFRGGSDGEDQIADAYRQKGTLDGWIEAVAPVAAYPKALLALYAACVPALLPVLEVPNFIVDWSGRTSTGKTTTLQIAGSVVGNPDTSGDSALSSWDTTRVGGERYSAVLNGLPTILDDTKRAKKPEEVGRFIYDYAHGRGRTRGNTRGLNRSATWRGVLLTSGEAPITTFTQHGGTRGRVVAIKGKPFGADNPETRQVVDAVKAGIRGNYGHPLPLVVEWLQADRDRWGKLQKQYAATVDRHAAGSESNIAGRLAQYTAAIATTAQVVHAAFRDAGHPLPWKYADPMAPLWDSIVDDLAAADTDVRAVEEVMSWADSNLGRFVGEKMDVTRTLTPSGGWLGRWVGGDNWRVIEFYPTQLKAFLNGQGYRHDEVIAGWHERGWLETDPGRKDKQVRMDNGRPRMIVLKRVALQEVEG